MQTQTLPYRLSPKHSAIVIPQNLDAHLVPHKTIEHKGNTFMLIPHRTDTTRFLRNLGYDIPAPILTQYDWEGTTPFESQKVTAALLTTNQRAYVLNEMGCVDADTEYLGPTGWRRIADYTDGQVAQYWPETGTIEFVEPDEFVKLPCHTMVRIKTSRGLDQLLSPEHRVLLHAYSNPEKQEVVSALELLERFLANRKAPTRHKIGIKQAAIPVTFSARGGEGLPLSDATLRVQVAVHADGYLPGVGGKVTVRLKKQRKKSRLRQLLKAADIEFTETSKDYPTAKGYTVFRFTPPIATKHYGPEWWECTDKQRRIIADEVVHWDGNTDGKRRRFSTYCEADADFVQYCFASTGSTARASRQVRSRRGRVEIEYTVQVRDNGRPLQIYGANKGTPAKNMWLENSPDGFKYCFRVPSTFLLFRRNGCIFASGNTGKTRAALYAFDFLQRNNAAKKMIVVAPLSNLNVVWMQEIFSYLPHLSSATVHGTKAQRLRALNEDVDIYIINHDGVKVVLPELQARTDIDVVLLDELAIYRNRRTDRWATANKLLKGRKWGWGMTGGPMPKQPTDAWAQAQLITPDNVPWSFKRFREEVMYQVNQFRWVPRKGALERVHEVMQPSVRFLRKDCTDLPPTTYGERYAELSQEQAKAYKQMQDSFVLTHAQGTITAMNAGVQMGKLIQICCGFAYGDNGKWITLDHKNRVNVMLEVVEQAEAKVIIYVPYKRAITLVEDALRDQYSFATVTGDTPKTERDRIFNLFQHTSAPHVLIAHPKVAAHGLTLTRANTILWYGVLPDLEIYDQACARVTRPGQKLHTHILHIVSTKAERKVVKTLETRGNLQAELLDLFKHDNR